MDASTLIFGAACLCGGALAFEKATSKSISPDAESELQSELSAPTRPHHPKFAALLSHLGSAFFPLLLVFVVRVAVVEPFRIPSGSMMPGLVSGDFIAVDKSSWGVKLPWSDSFLIAPRHEPRRGDVAVFRYPKDPSMDYIKRLVGLPGDHVQYKNKRLTINGLPAQYNALTPFADPERAHSMLALSETIPGSSEPHAIAIEAGTGSFPPAPELTGACLAQAAVGDFDCVVPSESYLAMGDNRDHSADSRYWGFVPRTNLVGHAVYIWLSLRGLDRIGPVH